MQNQKKIRIPLFCISDLSVKFNQYFKKTLIQRTVSLAKSRDFFVSTGTKHLWGKKVLTAIERIA